MEGRDVDFKQSPDVDAGDIVAFANASGGTLLLGVKEDRRPDGTEFRQVIGCQADDKNRLRVLQKAAGCSPQIDVHIQFENVAKLPIIRVDVPAGKSKPYSTGGGTYKIRENGNNKPLLPSHLLSLFLESETRHFVSAFKNVGSDLTNQLTEAIRATGTNIGEHLGSLEQSFEAQLRKLLFEFESNIEHQSTLMAHQIGEVQYYVESMLETVDGSSFLMEQFADLHERMGTQFAAVKSICERMHTGLKAISAKESLPDFDREFWRERVASEMHQARLGAAAHGLDESDANVSAVRCAFLLSRCPADFLIIKSLCDELLPNLPDWSICLKKTAKKRKVRPRRHRPEPVASAPRSKPGC